MLCNFSFGFLCLLLFFVHIFKRFSERQKKAQKALSLSLSLSSSRCVLSHLLEFWCDNTIAAISFCAFSLQSTYCIVLCLNKQKNRPHILTKNSNHSTFLQFKESHNLLAFAHISLTFTYYCFFFCRIYFQLTIWMHRNYISIANDFLRKDSQRFSSKGFPIIYN